MSGLTGIIVGFACVFKAVCLILLLADEVRFNQSSIWFVSHNFAFKLLKS
jgi:hypothetical protein